MPPALPERKVGQWLPKPPGETLLSDRAVGQKQKYHRGYEGRFLCAKQELPYSQRVLL